MTTALSRRQFLGIAAAAPFADWFDHVYTGRSVVRASQGMVATSQPPLQPSELAQGLSPPV